MAIARGDSLNLKYNSFSGTDIQCFFFGDNISVTLDDIISSSTLSDADKRTLTQKVTKQTKPIQPFGELQTLTVSSARSFGPIRRLGEIEPIQYKGGARTIAGTMVFAVLNRDVFAAYMDRTIPGVEDNGWSGPDFVDEIPPFNILIQGANEYGSFANGILIGVKITNFGTTFSVDDMMTEATYNYVAQHYSPFVDDVGTTLKYYYNQVNSRATTALSTLMSNNSVTIKGSNGTVRTVSRNFYEFLQKLPEDARNYYIDFYDSTYKAYEDESMSYMKQLGINTYNK